MGNEQSSNHKGANDHVRVEPVSKDVNVERNKVNTKPTSFTLPTNTYVSYKSYQFTDRNVKAVLSVRGPGVIRVGLTTTDPSLNQNVLEGSVFEKEEGFDFKNKDVIHRRVLYRSEFGWFCFGKQDAESEFTTDNEGTNLWLYIIFVYGQPDVTCQVFYDNKAEKGEVVIFSALGVADAVDEVIKDIKSNTVVFKISDQISNSNIYRLRWDMLLQNENIPGKSRSPEYGYMHLRLQTNANENNTGVTIWERGSAVKDFPFSSVIAFCVSLAEQTVTHNLLVNSVGKTSTDRFTNENTGQEAIYLTVEYSSGQIEITHSNVGLIRQDIGSILLVSDYNLEEGLTNADISLAIASTTGFTPRRIQFGNTTAKFVVEFSQRLEVTQIQQMRRELRVNIRHLSETKQVQVISVNKENIDTYDLEQHFSRRTVGGGTLHGNITRDSSVPFNWIVNFMEERVARRVWLMKTHRILAGNQKIKTIVLPYYTELGLATNYGEMPVFDRSPLVITVDSQKLSFILTKEEKRKDFEKSITKKVNVHIIFPENKTTNSSADSDEEIEENEPSLDNQGETKDILTFECCLSNKDVTRHTIWKDICREEVQKYFENFIFVRQISVDDSMWDKALEIMETFGPECSIVCKENISDKVLLLLGSDLQTLEKQANRVQSSLSLNKDICREISIKIESYLALDRQEKLHSIRSECPNTSMKVNRETQKVTFKGPQDEVDNAEREVLHLATKVRVITIPLNQDDSIAQTEKGRNFIFKKLKDKNLCTAIDIKFSENKIQLHIYAQDDEDEERQKNQIRDAITENVKCHCINLSISDRQILQQPYLKRMLKTIEEKGSLVIVCNENVILYGTSEAVDAALKDVEVCINTLKSDHVEINVSIDVSKFLDCFRPYRDELECMKDKNGSLTGKLHIHGKANNVGDLTKTIRSEISEVTTHWFYLKKRWIARQVKELSDITFLDTNDEFLVHCEEGHTLASQGIITVAVLSHCGAVLQVRQGDITFETTDVIVNSVVGDLNSFDKGLAQYINYQGGGKIKSEFLQELNTKVEPHCIAVGEMVTTGPGCLRCMQIMHTLPPNWKGGNDSEEEHMKELVENILKTCDDRGMMSVSIPALGCGSRRYPIDKATRIIVQVATEYISKNPSKITEIILCDRSKQAAESFADAVDKLKGPWFVFRHKLDLQVEDFMTSIGRRAGGTPASQSSRGNQLANQLSLRPEEALARPQTAGLRYKGVRRSERQPNARTDDDLHVQDCHIDFGNPIFRRRNERVVYSPPSTYSSHSDVDDIVIVKVISKNKGKTIQQQIEQMVDEQYITKEISYVNLCKEHKLTQEEEKELKSLEDTFGLDVTIDKTAQIVKLAGLREIVDTCQFEALYLLQNKFPEQRRKRKNEDQVAEIEQWCCEKDGVVQVVDRSSNFELWHGHRQQKDFKYFNQAEQIEYSVRYMSIGQMEETLVTNPGNRRRLYISNQADTVTALPPQWTILKSNKFQAQVELGIQEIEYQNVRVEFRNGGCGNRNIKKIIRLENHFMWQQYQLKKRYLESINPQVEVEKRLWHGTSRETAQTIISNGFDRGFAGQANAAAYGNGVYFAVKSSYSDGYARPDAHGVKQMFLNRVLTGMYYQGHANLSALPEKPGVHVQGINVCYDSAVDNVKKPTIYVIFHDTQVYPEYLIEYTI